MKKLTKAEALEQGYTLCGYSKHTDWQSLMSIKDLSDEELSGDELVLASKDFERPTATANWVKELIADSMESDWGGDTGDDTEEVFNAINELDFTTTAEMINKALLDIKSYKLTDIVLIK